MNGFRRRELATQAGTLTQIFRAGWVVDPAGPVPGSWRKIDNRWLVTTDQAYEFMKNYSVRASTDGSIVEMSDGSVIIHSGWIKSEWRVAIGDFKRNALEVLEGDTADGTEWLCRVVNRVQQG